MPKITNKQILHVETIAADRSYFCFKPLQIICKLRHDIQIFSISRGNIGHEHALQKVSTNTTAIQRFIATAIHSRLTSLQTNRASNRCSPNLVAIYIYIVVRLSGTEKHIFSRFNARIEKQSITTQK